MSKVPRNEKELLYNMNYNDIMQNNRKNRNNITTIALTQKNWEYLNTFDPKLKYSVLIEASRLSKIYNPKKDQYK